VPPSARRIAETFLLACGIGFTVLIACVLLKTGPVVGALVTLAAVVGVYHWRLREFR
jgi:hypothetical protein